MCVTQLSQCTAIICLYRVKRLVFVMAISCVYCEVRNTFLCVTLKCVVFKGPCHDYVSRRHLTAEARVRSHAHQWYLLWKKWHCDRFLSQYLCFLQSFSFHQPSTLIFIFGLFLSEGQVDEVWKPSNTTLLFLISWKHFDISLIYRLAQQLSAVWHAVCCLQSLVISPDRSCRNQ